MCLLCIHSSPAIEAMLKTAALAVALGFTGIVAVTNAQVAPAGGGQRWTPQASCQVAKATLTSDALPSELTQKQLPLDVPHEVARLKKSTPRVLNMFEIGGVQNAGAKFVALTECTPHIEITDAVCICIDGELGCVYSPDDCCEWRLCGGPDNSRNSLLGNGWNLRHDSNKASRCRGGVRRPRDGHRCSCGARMRFRLAPEGAFAEGGANFAKPLPTGTVFLYRVGDVEPRSRVP